MEEPMEKYKIDYFILWIFVFICFGSFVWQTRETRLEQNQRFDRQHIEVMNIVKPMQEQLAQGGIVLPLAPPGTSDGQP
jgi:hypothetical protein